MTILQLPSSGGNQEPLTLTSGSLPAIKAGRWNRIAYAATHVVSNPLSEIDPWLEAAIDWDRTLAFREYLWDLGLGVAEAMDTAQRGTGVDWPTSLELIQRTAAAAKARNGALLVCGAGTDHLATAAEFPHVYGPIETRAITRIGRLGKKLDAFQWPTDFSDLAARAP